MTSFFTIEDELEHAKIARFGVNDSMNLLSSADKDSSIPSPTESLFEFETPLGLPLSQSISKQENELDKTVGIWSGMALLIGATIGSGIFASPGPVLEYTQSAGAALLAWIIAGVITMLGGLCYAELGTMMPSSGGDFTYLLRAYGTLPASLFSFATIFINSPGSNAIVSVVSAEYLCKLIYFNRHVDSIPWWLSRVLAITILCVLTIIHIWSTKASTKLQNVLTALKLISLSCIAILGISRFIQGQDAHHLDDALFNIPAVSAGNVSLAIYTALWAYDGWNNLNFVAGEMHDPVTDLPRAIIGSTLIVISVFVIVNIAYFAVLAPAVVMETRTIALEFGKQVFGHAGGIIIPLIVIAATTGTLNVGIFTGARIAFATGKDRQIHWLGRLNQKTRTPRNAILLQFGLTILFILHGDFKSLVNFYSMISYSFYFLTVLGLLVLRVTDPFEERPFKPWIGIPILFCIITFLVLICSVIEAPIEAITTASFFIVGTIIYLVIYILDLNAEGVKDTVRSSLSKIPIPAMQQYFERWGYSRQGDLDQYELDLAENDM